VSLPLNRNVTLLLDAEFGQNTQKEDLKSRFATYLLISSQYNNYRTITLLLEDNYAMMILLLECWSTKGTYGITRKLDLTQSIGHLSS